MKNKSHAHKKYHLYKPGQLWIFIMLIACFVFIMFFITAGLYHKSTGTPLIETEYNHTKCYEEGKCRALMFIED